MNVNLLYLIKIQGLYRKPEIKIKDFSRTSQHECNFCQGRFYFLLIVILTQHRKNGNVANTIPYEILHNKIVPLKS